jgi:hypothetical protein
VPLEQPPRSSLKCVDSPSAPMQSSSPWPWLAQSRCR